MWIFRGDGDLAAAPRRGCSAETPWGPKIFKHGLRTARRKKLPLIDAPREREPERQARAARRRLQTQQRRRERGLRQPARRAEHVVLDAKRARRFGPGGFRLAGFWDHDWSFSHQASYAEECRLANVCRV